jgi:D-glycerate 3-kinase
MLAREVTASMTASDAHDRDIAAKGPAFAALSALGPIDWQAWRVAAARLERDLAGADDLPARIHQLYLPVLFFCLAQRRDLNRRPLMVGLQAPQGGGKTTLVTHLLRCLADLNLAATAVSIDDFYLPRESQVRLAAAHPGNPYLEHRGYPGTHDVALGESTLIALQNIRSGETVRVPVYDKSKHAGRGDRLPEAEWREVTGPLDVVFVEGWMLGFSPVPGTRLEDSWLVEPNRALESYDRWYRHLDCFVTLRAMDPTYVLRWRVEAEEKMRASGKPGLSREEIEDYVRRFLPAYRTYGGAPAIIPEARRFTIRLDDQRRPHA